MIPGWGGHEIVSLAHVVGSDYITELTRGLRRWRWHPGLYSYSPHSRALGRSAEPSDWRCESDDRVLQPEERAK